MWWSDKLRSALVGAALLLLTGCGFHPLYSQDPAGRGTTPQLASILIPEPVAPLARRTGQLLRINLQDSLTPGGIPARPLYALNINLNESEQELALTKAEEATRINLIVSISYTLVDLKDGKRLHSHSLRAISSFSRLRADFGNVSAESDARARAARELAEAMRIELANWFDRFAPAAKS